MIILRKVIIMDDKNYFSYLSKRSRLSLFIRRILLNEIKNYYHGKILDIGCGIGEFLSLYQDSVGLDINFYTLKYCLEKGLTCLLSKVESLPFANSTFDGIFISNVLEHLIKPRTMMEEAVRVLKPLGIFVVTVPMRAGFEYDKTHVTYLDSVRLETLANNCGLVKNKMYSYPIRIKFMCDLLYFCELRGVFIKQE